MESLTTIFQSASYINAEAAFFAALEQLIAAMEKKQHHPKHLMCLYRMNDEWKTGEWQRMTERERRNEIQGLGIFLTGQPHAIGDVFLCTPVENREDAVSFWRSFRALADCLGI